MYCAQMLLWTMLIFCGGPQMSSICGHFIIDHMDDDDNNYKMLNTLRNRTPQHYYFSPTSTMSSSSSPSSPATLTPISAKKFLPPNHSNKQLDSLAVYQPGDIILGGLFPVHEKGEDGEACGRKVYNRGVHRLEAMLYAVDRVNNDSTLLPGIKIGVHILDTCSRDTYALNQSLQFVRSALNNLDTSAFECLDQSEPRLRRKSTTGPVFGVIGGSYSSVSLQVANLLRLFHIPQISPASTAKALSDKTRFDLFARTVPPDTFQSIALVDIVKHLNWSYISTIHSEGSYGEYGIEAFHKEAIERNVCIAAAEKVPSQADDSIFDEIIGKLMKKPNARGVILFTRAEDARSILQAAKRANLTRPFHWIASDGWGRQQKLLEGVEDVAEGAVTVELHSEIIEDFDRYMLTLTPANNKRNPWFKEYWETTFDCILEQEDYGKLMSKLQHSTSQYDQMQSVQPLQLRQKICDEKFRLSEEVGYEQESKSQFVIDAVYAFAHALNNLREDICPPDSNENSNQYDNTSPSEQPNQMKSIGDTCSEVANYDGRDFYNNYLLNVTFLDIAGSVVKFDRQGDALARYDILNVQKSTNSSGYHYKLVGKWFNGLHLQLSDLTWNKGNDFPASACSRPCAVGMIKKQQGDTCCWICDSCEPYEYVSDETTCTDCGPGYWPYPDKKSCFALNIRYLHWENIFALVPLTIAAGGILTTITVIGLFIKNNNTPLVRASGRELSYAMLFGILLCYANTFALIVKPTAISCILQRFSIGVAFSTMYSALLTKTNRIQRIFNSAPTSAKRLKYISPQSQVVITAALIGVQIFITLIWMIIEPPGIQLSYPDRTVVLLKCNIQEISFLCSQTYNVFLIVICTIYAFKTRKIPENFNESKFIGFAMYTTCIIWLAFVPIYFGTRSSFEVQVSTLCISISLSASAALVCLYAPKVNILLFHPEKNVRRLTMMNTAMYRRSAETTGPIIDTGTSNATATGAGVGCSVVVAAQSDASSYSPEGQQPTTFGMASTAVQLPLPPSLSSPPPPPPPPPPTPYPSKIHSHLRQYSSVEAIPLHPGSLLISESHELSSVTEQPRNRKQQQRNCGEMQESTFD